VVSLRLYRPFNRVDILMFAWLAAKWASKAASNILIGIIALIMVTGVGYVQQLRVKVARCEGSAQMSERNERLADRLATELGKDRDEAIEIIEDAQSDCLDASVDELLRAPD